MTLRRPVLRYHGSKWRLAPWIISHFPAHQHYCEVFGGGASVLLSKEPSPIETYNDLDHGVVTFFKVLRERPEDLQRVCALTPWAREELKRSRQPCDESVKDPELETARRLFVGAWMGRGKATAQWSTGWRYEIEPIRHTRAYEDIIDVTDGMVAVATRLKRVQIECGDALAVIHRFDSPTTLFYVDPPYVGETRSDRWHAMAYRYEMTDEDHRRLAEALRGARAMVVVSGYPSALYDELYAGWDRSTRTTRTDAGAAVECLWLSPNVARTPSQRKLWEVTNG